MTLSPAPLLVERGKVLGKQIGTEARWMMPKCAVMDLLILFLAIETPETFLYLAASNAPLIGLVSGKKQNGGSPCHVKMTSFAQIVRVADR